jgi:hypothetical protein
MTNTNTTAFWFIVPCSRVKGGRLFRGACFSIIGGSTHIWIVGRHQRNCRALYPRKYHLQEYLNIVYLKRLFSTIFIYQCLNKHDSKKVYWIIILLISNTWNFFWYWMNLCLPCLSLKVSPRINFCVAQACIILLPEVGVWFITPLFVWCDNKQNHTPCLPCLFYYNVSWKCDEDEIVWRNKLGFVETSF